MTSEKELYRKTPRVSAVVQVAEDTLRIDVSCFDVHLNNMGDQNALAAIFSNVQLRPGQRCHVHFGKIESATTAALATLFALQEKVASQKGELRVSATPTVMAIMHVMGLTELAAKSDTVPFADSAESSDTKTMGVEEVRAIVQDRGRENAHLAEPLEKGPLAMIDAEHAALSSKAPAWWQRMLGWLSKRM